MNNIGSRKYYLKALLLWPIKIPLSYILSFFYNSEFIEQSKLSSYNKSRIPGPKKTFCHAPEKNIYFSNTGRVSACCYNQDYPLGYYGEDNLEELLNSSNKKLLVKNLKNNNLSTGCEYCQNLIDSESYKAMGSHRYDMIPLDKNYPTMMEFELSNMCNLACIMCSPLYSSKLEQEENSGKERKTIYGKNFLKELEEFIPHLHKARFFGGEPFLIDIYYEIWEMIIKLNPKCEIAVQTNASILNEKIKQLLNKGNFRLNISIDSLKKDNYEFIRKGANFKQIMNNVNYYKEYSKLKRNPLFFSICPMRQNWMDIPELVNYCNENNIFINFSTVNNPYECSIINMHHKEINEIVELYSNQKLNSSNFAQRENRKHFIGLINQIREWYKLACDIEISQKTYPIEDIKEILKSKFKDLNNKEVIEKFENIFAKFPSQIELSDYHLNKIKKLKNSQFEKALSEKSEDFLKIKLNNLLNLNRIK